MTPLDRITEALRYLETVESHGGHLGGILPGLFAVEDLRVVVGMAGSAQLVRSVLSHLDERALWLRKEWQTGGDYEHLSAREKECVYTRDLVRSALQPQGGK